MLPREIRLNNPCGVKRTTQHWHGASTMQDDPAFIRFDTPTMGLRAAMKILLTYQEHHGLDTIKTLIGRWAPPSENETEAYIDDVCARLHAGPDDHIDLEIPDTLIRMAEALVRHECGASPDPTLPYWYADEVFEEAAALALGTQINANA